MSRTSYLRRPLAALLMAALAAIVVMAVVVFASPAWAATYTVTNTNDSGSGSLRRAINDANTTTGVADTINFNLGSAATITLTSAQLPTITDGAGLTINGGRADITISGANQYRVFEVGSGAKLTLSNLTVADGAASDRDFGGGGGILNAGTVTVRNSTLSGNSSNGGGGGIFNGGTLEVSNSTLSGNSSGNSAPGGGAPGGGIFNGGTATVSNSTLSGNSAIYDGGGIFNAGSTLEISNSTLSGNSAAGGGGGLNNAPIGIENATATVSNSTISGSSASFGGGIIMFWGALEVSNSTLSGNTGGAYLSLGTTATFKNTIVANSPSVENCWSIPNDGGYNLDSDNTCGFSPDNNSISGVDPKLGALADNGGPTLTHALLEGSPAIDKGYSFGATTDQRGLPRPSDFVGIVNAADGDGSDIGAFELQAPDTTPPKVTSTVPGNGGEVGPAANIRATFSEDMRSASVMNAFKLFKKGSTTQIAAQVSYDAVTDKATLNPTNNLSTGTYKAVVTTGAKDLAGNRLDQNSTTAGLQQKEWLFKVKK